MTSVATPLAGDARALASLRARAGSEPQAAAREAARQFEALFMNELMKSMRASTMKAEGDSAGAALGTEMLDAQWAMQMSGQRGGLSEAITKHLERQMGMAPGPIPVPMSVPVPGPAALTAPRPTAMGPLQATNTKNNSPVGQAVQPLLKPAPALEAPVRLPQRSAAAFVQQHSAAAERAQQQTGVPAAFMVAQAAHETGWGRKEIRHADGSPSYNLFGIKAGGSWKGAVAETTTTEYVGGQPRRGVAAFRAYNSYAESFADYAQMLKTSPRYQGALQAATQASGALGVGSAGLAQAAGKAPVFSPVEPAAPAVATPAAAKAAAGLAPAAAAASAAARGFAQGLQRAGYATDPEYAAKLTRVINTTLRLQRSVGA
jgi:peptidoglycan hydrolase FlgJ